MAPGHDVPTVRRACRPRAAWPLPPMPLVPRDPARHADHATIDDATARTGGCRRTSPDVGERYTHRRASGWVGRVPGGARGSWFGTATVAP